MGEKSSPDKEKQDCDDAVAVASRCGYGKFKPDCLQSCAKPGVLLACLCLFAVVETYVQWGLVNVMMSTWERRYDLKSTQSVWIVTLQEIVSGICAPVFGFMAAFWHKGKMVTWAAIGMVVGCFLFLVPQFATDPYALGSSEASGTCNIYDNSTYDACADDVASSNLSAWLGVFLTAQLIWGYVGSSLWTVGITYMDDNCKQADMYLYLGIFNALAAFGATMGFIGGGLSLEVYVDVFKVDMDTINIDSSDPRWVGAWWIGFLAALFAAIPSMFLIPCFPKQLPGIAELKKNEKSFVHKGIGAQEDAEGLSRKQSCYALGQAIKWIFVNPVFVLETIAGALEMGSVTAMAAFLPKVIQFQFGQSASMAAFISGAVIVPAAIIGQLLGGVFPKCCKLNIKQTIWMQSICAYLCVICSFGFLARCDITPIAGFNTDYPLNSTIPYDDSLTHSCNDQCNCTTRAYDPICSIDGMSYFSPCYGGCVTEYETADGLLMYGNCSCMPNATLPYYQAEEGICPVDCSEFWLFMPALFLMTAFTFMENTGGYGVVMRTVPQQHRAFAFGIQSPIIKLLGTVPIPILFGYVFDLSCELWQDNCGEQGACWIYDSRTVSVGLFAAGVIVKTITGSIFLAAVFCYKPPSADHDMADHEIVIEADKSDIFVQNGSVNKGYEYYFGESLAIDESVRL